MDYLVVGAGFFGAVMAERIASQLDKKVLIIDKRDHIGGNCHSQVDERTGIEFHTYGTHIFHTNSYDVWNYLSQFTKWNDYIHQVKSMHQGELYEMPINLNTINKFFKKSFRSKEAEEFIKSKIALESITRPQNLEEKAISLVGSELYEAFIKGYTQKQWQADPVDLPESIINRLPFYFDTNTTYFKNAKFQGIPLDGFTALFENMLDHPNIEIQTGIDYFKEKKNYKPKERTIYSGPIDQFFDYKFGRLDWRTVHLKKEYVATPQYQELSVINYSEKAVPFTRIHEPIHLYPERNFRAKEGLIFKETSGYDAERPYYPIRDQKNLSKFLQYQKESKKLKNVVFGGRLGSYSYIDMDQAVSQALASFKQNCFLKGSLNTQEQ